MRKTAPHTVYLIGNNINSKGYVGITCGTLMKRFMGHIYLSYNGKTKLYQDMREFGVENFYVFELDKVKITDLFSASWHERRWIEKYNTFEPFGYNIYNTDFLRLDSFDFARIMFNNNFERNYDKVFDFCLDNGLSYETFCSVFRKKTGVFNQSELDLYNKNLGTEFKLTA